MRPRILGRLEDARATRARRPSSSRRSSSSRAGWRELCDEVWLVTCDADAQLERLLRRGADHADAEARIAAQSDIVDRLTPAATRIIDTSGSVSDARRRVKAAFRAALGHEAP